MGSPWFVIISSIYIVMNCAPLCSLAKSSNQAPQSAKGAARSPDSSPFGISGNRSNRAESSGFAIIVTTGTRKWGSRRPRAGVESLNRAHGVPENHRNEIGVGVLTRLEGSMMGRAVKSSLDHGLVCAACRTKGTFVTITRKRNSMYFSLKRKLFCWMGWHTFESSIIKISNGYLYERRPMRTCIFCYCRQVGSNEFMGCGLNAKYHFWTDIPTLRIPIAIARDKHDE